MEGDKPLFQTDSGSKDQDAAITQEFKLFIKASTIDKETRGSCPICQQWFMVAYLIAQKQDGVNFSVYTVQESSPPKEFEAWSKKFPVVLPVNCVDKKGNQIGGELCDNFEELERFFEDINRECPQLKRHNKENSEAVKRVESLYAKFNKFLQGQHTANLTKALRDLNDELDNENNFFIDDQLCFVDCYLLPRLQHIRIACKRYADFNIPEDCKHLWSYLGEAYKHPAFIATMPSDQDIVNHYSKKVTAFRQVKNLTTEKFTYTTDIPEGIINEVNGDKVQQNAENNGVEQQRVVADNSGSDCDD